MRRHFSLSKVLFLGLAAAIGLIPGILAAQGVEDSTPILDKTSDFNEGLNIEEGATGTGIAEYTITFNEPGSYIPERLNPASMVVKVLSGTIAFRVQTLGVVVETPGPAIRYVTADPLFKFGENPDPAFPAQSPPDTRSYSAPVDWPDICAASGIYTLCALDPLDFERGERFVLLEAGYTVFLPPGSACFLCNITPLADGGTAQVLVWTTEAGFDYWSAEPPHLATQAGQNFVEQQGLSETRTWMLNPGSNCK